MPAEQLPAWTLVQAAHAAERHFVHLFREAGLTPPEYGVLALLQDDESRTQAELARLVLIRPQSMAALVSALIGRGLVVRDGPGGRGRRAGISLTEEGRSALARTWPTLSAFNAPASLGLTAAQAAMLDELLRQVRTTLETRTTPDQVG